MQRGTLASGFINHMIKLSFPFTEEKIRALKVGDEVLISGIVFTGRDAVHILVNERPVEPWDPFMAEHPATLPLSDELKFGGVRIPIRGFVLPHFSKLTKAEHEAGAGPRGWLAHQGFYVYRRDRLLCRDVSPERRPD